MSAEGTIPVINFIRKKNTNLIKGRSVIASLLNLGRSSSSSEAFKTSSERKASAEERVEEYDLAIQVEKQKDRTRLPSRKKLQSSSSSSDGRSAGPTTTTSSPLVPNHDERPNSSRHLQGGATTASPSTTIDPFSRGIANPDSVNFLGTEHLSGGLFLVTPLNQQIDFDGKPQINPSPWNSLAGFDSTRPFAVRFSGMINIISGGNYTFTMYTDAMFRLVLGGRGASAETVIEKLHNDPNPVRVKSDQLILNEGEQ